MDIKTLSELNKVIDDNGGNDRPNAIAQLAIIIKKLSRAEAAAGDLQIAPAADTTTANQGS